MHNIVVHNTVHNIVHDQLSILLVRHKAIWIGPIEAFFACGMGNELLVPYFKKGYFWMKINVPAKVRQQNITHCN